MVKVELIKSETLTSELNIEEDDLEEIQRLQANTRASGRVALLFSFVYFLSFLCLCIYVDFPSTESVMMAITLLFIVPIVFFMFWFACVDSPSQSSIEFILRKNGWDGKGEWAIESTDPDVEQESTLVNPGPANAVTVGA